MAAGLGERRKRRLAKERVERAWGFCVDSATGKGGVVAEVVTGEVKRTGESKTLMGAFMAGKKTKW